MGFNSLEVSQKTFYVLLIVVVPLISIEGAPHPISRRRRLDPILLYLLLLGHPTRQSRDESLLSL